MQGMDLRLDLRQTLKIMLGSIFQQNNFSFQVELGASTERSSSVAIFPAVDSELENYTQQRLGWMCAPIKQFSNCIDNHQ